MMSWFELFLQGRKEGWTEGWEERWRNGGMERHRGKVGG